MVAGPARQRLGATQDTWVNARRKSELATAQDRNLTPELTVRDQPTDVGL